MHTVFFISFIICLFAINSFAQNTTPVIVGQSFTMKSAILNEERKVLVALPRDYEKSTQKYPVIYVLDAEWNFPFVAEAVKVLADSERIPPSIVIGVTNSDRNRDFTTKLNGNFQKPDFMKETGGADNFLNYLEKDLVPMVDKILRTEPHRTLIGHSLGGLFAWHSLASRPQLFQSYLILDASVFWDNGVVVKEVKEFFKQNPVAKSRVFWGRDRIPREVWFDQNTELLEFWEKNPPKNVKFKFYEMDEETHSTLVFPGSYIGLRSLYADYLIPYTEKMTLADVTDHYAALSKEFGYEVRIPRGRITGVSGQFKTLKMFKDAIGLYQIGLKVYPPSLEILDGLAETYEADNQPKLALETYQKADALTGEQSETQRKTRQSKIDSLKKQLNLK